MGDSFSWDDLRLVLAVADGRGLGPASERLGIDGSTVFRRLGQLEGRLGLKLFERHRTGYVATASGADMAGLARRVDEEVAGLALRLAGGAAAASGEVRVTTDDTFLVQGLGPVLARFRERHPAITLDLVVSNELLNLSRRDADVALRVTDQPPETLVGRRLATVAWAVYGRVAEHGTDGRGWPQDAAWIGPGEGLATLPFARFVADAAASGRIVCRVNSVLALVASVESGIGIAPVPCFAADRNPRLVRLAPPDPALDGSLWLLTHPDLRDSPRVRALMDHLAAELSAWRPLLAGDQPQTVP